jgi:hypothetical protein
VVLALAVAAPTATQGPAAGAVQAIEPAGGMLASITPAFRWTVTDTLALPRPITYRIRVARDSALGAPTVDTVLLDVERYDLRRPLKPGPSLFWRVDATASTGARDSTGLVGPLPVPAWATLTTLNDVAGSNTDDPRPLFTWTSPAIAAPPGPFSYNLFVRRAATGVAAGGVAGISGTSARSPVALETNVAYTWWVVAQAGGDTSLTQSVGIFTILDATLPRTTLLFQNFPNPFPSGREEATCLWFDLATTGLVELDVLDLRGNLVRRFIPGPELPAILPAGRYGRAGVGGPTCDSRLIWNGTAGDGRTVPPGVYLTRLKAAGQVFVRRIVFRGRGGGR